MTTENLINKARAYAAAKHKDQKRKDGKPYFTHVEAVAGIVRNDWLNLMPFHALTVWGPLYENIVDAAYLHDVIEDCGVTKEDIKAEGFTPLTAEIVEVVSRKKDENYLDFIVRIMNSGSISVGAIAVKLADLQHNMSDLSEGSLKDKYRLAHFILSQRISRVN